MSRATRQQRTPPAHAARVVAQLRHGGKAARTRAAKKLQQQRLGLVVAMMRERDDGRAACARGLDQRRVPHVTRFGLEARPRRARNFDPMHRKRGRRAAAELFAERGPRIGVRGDAVMHVGGTRMRGSCAATIASRSATESRPPDSATINESSGASCAASEATTAAPITGW
jgi:hypothetical protein